MEETFTETHTESYGSRMKSACTGVCFGFLLFFGSIGLLIWNEGRTVKRAKDIDEGQDNVVEIDLNNINSLSEYENKLVYISGPLSTTDTLMDPIFGVGFVNDNAQGTSSNATNVTTTTFPASEEKSALKLSRNVEMYQWMESSTSQSVRTGNGGKTTETNYTYSMVWSSILINSANFKNQSDTRQNPTSFPFEPLVLEADPILLSDVIELSKTVTGLINWYESYNDISLDDVVDKSLRLTTVGKNTFYYTTRNGTNYSPKVGDTRVTFDYVPPDDISIVALFRKNTLDEYQTSRGGSLLLLKRGTFSSNELFQQAEGENTTLAWVLRVVGFVLMVVSILLLLQPLATAVDIIPCVGDCLADGMEGCLFPLIAFIIAIPVSLFVIMLAWIAYRPYIAVPIVVVCLGLIVWMVVRHRKKKKEHDNNEKQEMTGEKVNSTSEQGKIDNPYHTGVMGAPVVAQTGLDQPADYSSQPGGGFSSALDVPNPPPSAPTAEAEVVIGEHYIPQVYKP